MTDKVVCVLRSGGEYGPEHVLRLRDQLARWAPDAALICLTDMQVDGVDVMPLEFGWPGWWSKMELFRPDLTGDFVYLDLDVAIIGDLSDLFAVRDTTVMRDAYRPEGLQSAAMVLMERDRNEVWTTWIGCPEHWMRRFRRGGDQAFLERVWRAVVPRLQDVLPARQLVSYKVDVRGRDIPDAAAIVMFHGRPRPWEVGW